LNKLIPKNELKRLFRSKIKPRITSLEKARRETLWKCFLFSVIFIYVSYLVIINFAVELVPKLLPFSIGVFSVILALGFKRISKSFVRKFKKDIVYEVFRSLVSDCQYNPGSFISRDKFLESGLALDTFDEYKGEDHVLGKIGEVKFE